MKEPKVKYRITIDRMAKEFKIFETVEEAVEFLRKTIEADGNHVFMAVKEKCDGTFTCQWMNWEGETPRMVSKTIGIGNKDELKAYAMWKRKEAEKADLERWEKIRKALIADRQAKNNQKIQKITKAIQWID